MITTIKYINTFYVLRTHIYSLNKFQVYNIVLTTITMLNIRYSKRTHFITIFLPFHHCPHFPHPSVPGKHFSTLLFHMFNFVRIHILVRSYRIFLSAYFNLYSVPQVNPSCCKWQNFLMFSG